MDMKNIESIISKFSKDRDWDKFHNPKNLVMAMSVEASELVEIFQWLDFEQAQNLSEEKKEHVKQEIADIVVYLTRICMTYNIDLEKAILEKMKINEKKYPLFDENGKRINYGKKK